MQPETTEHEAASTSFAGLLAAITASKTTSPDAQSPRSYTDRFEDDVATLSYERALQNHARYRSSEQPAPFAAMGSSPGARPKISAANGLNAEPSMLEREKKVESTRRSASVTIRMSPEEYVQLQQRSAEANLTISAYLRSCTFEAEVLRAQVKQALADLRTMPTRAQQPEPAGSRWLRLLHRQRSR